MIEIPEGYVIVRTIVRCKDCEFWGESQEGSCGAIDDPYMLHTDANDFCSWGKRRTDKVTEKVTDKVTDKVTEKE